VRVITGLVVVVAGVVFAMHLACSASPTGCQSDADCKGVRICVAATCVDPGTGGATGAGTPASSVASTGTSVVTGTGGAAGAGGAMGTGGTTTLACIIMYQDSGGTQHECMEFDDMPKSYVTSEHNYCTSIKGMPQSSGSTCATDNTLGFCTVPVPAGGYSYRMFYYADGEVTASYAQAGCVNEGEMWTPG
jgi:hypothetical protein